MQLIKLLHTFYLALKQNRRISDFDIGLLLRQFTILFIAGIPIIKCLDVLEKCQIKNAMRSLVFAVKKEILSGKDFHSSLRKQKPYFDEMTCQLIKIGEHTGKLDIMLTLITDEKEKYAAFRKKLKQALFYPMMITMTALLVTLSMFLFVIPKFSELFSDARLSLPWITNWVFFISSKLQHYSFIIFLVPVIFLMLLLPNPYISRIKNNIRHYLIRLPYLKSFSQKILLARFSRNLAMTYAAGMPITDALKLIMFANTNSDFTYWIIKLRNNIASGLQLHQAMQPLPCFPDMMVQMVKVGEESGTVEHLLNKTADMFEADINQFITQFSQLLEPLIMLMLGVLIGGLVIAMYLPIFKLGSVL
jgi:type IV pilus assembly protein PilC